MPRMTVANLSWYLCMLFTFMLIVLSAVSVVPGHGTFLYVLHCISAGLAITFATLAVGSVKFNFSESATMVRSLTVFAVFATILAAMTISF